MKKVRCKKELGTWFYKKIIPDVYNDLDAPIYELYDEQQSFEGTFGCYDEMKHYIETGHYW